MKKLLCALVCLTILLGGVSAFAVSEKKESADITMYLKSFYVWSIPEDDTIEALFTKTKWGNVMATDILLTPGDILNLYVAKDEGGFVMLNGENTMTYNLYNTLEDPLAEDAAPLADSDFADVSVGGSTLKLCKLVGTTVSAEERNTNIVTHIYYETTSTPTAEGEYSDDVTFYAIVETGN